MRKRYAYPTEVTHVPPTEIAVHIVSLGYKCGLAHVPVRGGMTLAYIPHRLSKALLKTAEAGVTYAGHVVPNPVPDTTRPWMVIGIHLTRKPNKELILEDI